MGGARMSHLCALRIGSCIATAEREQAITAAAYTLKRNSDLSAEAQSLSCRLAHARTRRPYRERCKGNAQARSAGLRVTHKPVPLLMRTDGQGLDLWRKLGDDGLRKAAYRGG